MMGTLGTKKRPFFKNRSDSQKILSRILTSFLFLSFIFVANMPSGLSQEAFLPKTPLFDLNKQAAKNTDGRIINCANYYHRTALAFKNGSSGISTAGNMSADGSVTFPLGLGGVLFCRYNDSGYRDYEYDALNRCTYNGSALQPYSAFNHMCKNPANSDPELGTWGIEIYMYFKGTDQRNQPDLLSSFPDTNKDVICLSGLAYYGRSASNGFNDGFLHELQGDCLATLGR